MASDFVDAFALFSTLSITHGNDNSTRAYKVETLCIRKCYKSVLPA